VSPGLLSAAVGDQGSNEAPGRGAVGVAGRDGGGLLARLLHGLAAHTDLHHYTRVPAYWGVLPRLARAVDLRRGERLLDVGCGTGIGSRVGQGDSLGFDPDPGSVQLARRFYPRAGHRFVAMAAPDLGLRDAAFDKAMLINMVHHLDDATLDGLLGELRRVVRGRVCVLDIAPDISNPVERFFNAHDRGRHVRERAALRAALARRYQVAAEQVFHNAIHTTAQVLFTLAP